MRRKRTAGKIGLDRQEETGVDAIEHPLRLESEGGWIIDFGNWSVSFYKVDRQKPEKETATVE